MVYFFIALAILLLGYLFYSKLVAEKIFVVDDTRTTPAKSMADGVDYVGISKIKNIFIQLLNIAGMGPILGGVAGAAFGFKAFIIIAVGNVVAGSVHDFYIGMISLRNEGKHLPELAKKYLGKHSSVIINIFALLVLFLVGVVFIITPVNLITSTFFEGSGDAVWYVTAAVIFVYYIIATVVPVDKIIGKIYPIFGATLLFSAIFVFLGLLIGWSDLGSMFEWGSEKTWSTDPIYPMFFMAVSCGLISGFHATQSPIVSRTLESEAHGRQAFYGAMVLEGVIAMIWAAAAIALFNYTGVSTAATDVVKEVSLEILGPIFGTIAVTGVIVLPITSGDTAFRSARNIIADFLDLDQTKIANRYLIAIPLFALAGIVVFARIDYNFLWRYFTWANQVTAAIALLTATAYLYYNKKTKFGWLTAFIPGLFILSATWVYILNNPELGFGIDNWTISTIVGVSITAATGIGLYFLYRHRANDPSLVD